MFHSCSCGVTFQESLWGGGIWKLIIVVRRKVDVIRAVALVWGFYCFKINVMQEKVLNKFLVLLCLQT